jgi:FkbM family methyltransferase
VRLFNFAVTTYSGEITFLICCNDGASSSIGEFNEDWPQRAAGSIPMTESVTVQCINICDFLRNEGIEYIDTYISDIQGMDLEVLKTLRPFFEESKDRFDYLRNHQGSKKEIVAVPADWREMDCTWELKNAPSE